MKKKLARIVIVLLLAAGSYYGYQRYQQGDGAVERGLKIYGTIEIRDAALAFMEQERIKDLLVEEGETVEEGQILARLDSSRLEAAIAEMRARIAAQQALVDKLIAGNRPQEVEQARAEVDAARVRVENVRQILSRLEKTSSSGATSVQDVDDARAGLEVETAQLKVREKALNLVLEGARQEDITAAKHQLQALQESLALLLIRLDDMALKAPDKGIIQSRILEKGELAGPAKPVYTLALTDPKWVRAYLPEPQLGRIKAGMKAFVISDSFPGQKIEGWVGFISPVAEFTPRAVQTEDLRTSLVYETRVFVKDEKDRLRQGMPVTVKIEEAQE